MNRLTTALMLASGLGFAAASQDATAITIDVTAASAPNAYGSPSWAGYVTNALFALENGLSTNGNRSIDPTGYETAPSRVDPGEIAVTSFNSWRGTVNPTGAFSSEYGNRVHFGLHAYGDGTTQFRLEDLTFEVHSSDTTDSLVFVGDFVGFNYGVTRYGIDWGADNAKGGGDDTIYNSGNGTTPVDEIVYIGVGNAWWPGGGDSCGAATPCGGAQAAMDDYFLWVAGESPLSVTGSYSILGSTGSDTVVIPEPASLALLALGLAGLGFSRRKKA